MLRNKREINVQSKFLTLFKICIIVFSFIIIVFNCLFYKSNQTKLELYSSQSRILNKTQAKIKNFSPFITFCIPVYNKISYLERLCLSILQSTNTNRNADKIMYEMVVVDSNSNDTSCEFFESLASILNKPFGSYVPIYNARAEVIEKYNIKQFIVNSDADYSSSFNTIPYANEPILKYDRCCIYAKIVKLKSTVQSNIARQIAVNHSSGKYIWQIDPDDMINTAFFPTLIAKITKLNNTDLIEFGFSEYVLQNGNISRTLNIRLTNNAINSNYEIVKRFLRKSVYWQLWHLIVRREVYLKAIQAIIDYVPNQEKIVFASDLFHYAPIVYYSNSYVSIRGIGYFYFYMNKGSVSLEIAKGKTKTQESGKMIYDFIIKLFEKSGIKIRESLKKIYM